MSKYWNKKINEAEPYVAGEQPKAGVKIIKLNTNENPYAPSPSLISQSFVSTRTRTAASSFRPSRTGRE